MINDFRRADMIQEFTRRLTLGETVKPQEISNQLTNQEWLEKAIFLNKTCSFSRGVVTIAFGTKDFEISLVFPQREKSGWHQVNQMMNIAIFGA